MIWEQNLWCQVAMGAQPAATASTPWRFLRLGNRFRNHNWISLMITNDGWFIDIVMPFLAPIEASQPRRVRDGLQDPPWSSQWRHHFSSYFPPTNHSTRLSQWPSDSVMVIFQVVIAWRRLKQFFPWKSEAILLKKFAEQQWRAAVPLQWRLAPRLRSAS